MRMRYQHVNILEGLLHHLLHVLLVLLGRLDRLLHPESQRLHFHPLVPYPLFLHLDPEILLLRYLHQFPEALEVRLLQGGPALLAAQVALKHHLSLVLHFVRQFRDYHLYPGCQEVQLDLVFLLGLLVRDFPNNKRMIFCKSIQQSLTLSPVDPLGPASPGGPLSPGGPRRPFTPLKPCSPGKP